MLKIIKAKPNPSGRDKVGNNIIPELQLTGEWIDIQNIGDVNVSIENIWLQHLAFSKESGQWYWSNIGRLRGALNINEIIRIHSGGVVNLQLMLFEDRNNANKHLFTGSNYVWNNLGDTARIVLITNNIETELDRANYVNAPDGRILIRRDYNNPLLS